MSAFKFEAAALAAVLVLSGLACQKHQQLVEQQVAQAETQPPAQASPPQSHPTPQAAAPQSQPQPQGEVLYNGIMLPAEWPPQLKEVPADPVTPHYLVSPPKLIPIDVGRQLFVDDFLIESTTLKRQCHQAEHYQGNPLAVSGADGPSGLGAYNGGLWWDYTDGKIKYWHKLSLKVYNLSYSQDGIHWDAPKFDVKPGTNTVLEQEQHSNAVLISPDQTDPKKRYVIIYSLTFDPPGFCRYWFKYSADGIHWGERHATDADCGDRSCAFYNPFRKVWVYSMRMGWVGPRTRRYWEVRDLEKGPYWKSDPVIGAPYWTGADSADPRRDDVIDAETKDRGFDYEPKAGVPCQLYSLDCVPYESLMVGMFSVWHGQPQDAQGKNIPKANMVSVGFSRDGWSFSRPDRRSLYETYGSYQESGELRNIQGVCGGCLSMGDYLYLYTGSSGTRLGLLRRDGFASMDAGREAGDLVTRPVSFTGKFLFVNVAAAQGKLRVAVLNEAGDPIKGFGLEDCRPITCDKTLQPVTWRGGDDLAALAGKPVRFRFELNNGQLYSFWVTPDKSGASHGYGGGPGYTAATDSVGMANYKATWPMNEDAAPTPVLWPRDGTYTGGVTVRIELPLFNAMPGATIRYTLDGTLPAEDSPKYDKPFTITKAGETVVKTRTFFKDLLPSPIVYGTFTIKADEKAPLIFQTLPQGDLPTGTERLYGGRAHG